MKVSPSIIAADLTRLGEQISQCDAAGAFSYHVDVMDGHFVNNITLGTTFTAAMRKCTETEIECHLMIDRPDRYYEMFRAAGADTLLCHVESPMQVGSFFNRLKGENIPFGVVLNPETPFSKAVPYLENASIFLVMSVHPGFSGQKFIPDVLDKVSQARDYARDNSLDYMIEIDGGINNVTGKQAKDAGADILVSASYIFGGNIGERIGILKNL